MLQTGLTTVGLLIVSNIFMIFAWYGHLKLQESGISTSWPIYAVVLFSWAIALAEYAFQVPANRMGFVGNGGPFTLMQLKVMQEVITLVIFVIFANCFFEGSELKWNHLVAFVLLVGAVYFVFLDTSK
ncbi:MAG: DMT family protein [Rikenellaceae bacterium]